jgi:hypothetical protein
MSVSRNIMAWKKNGGNIVDDESFFVFLPALFVEIK